MKAKQLANEFQGVGEVKGKLFKQLKKTPYAYLYQVGCSDGHPIYYEVFRKRVNTRFNTVTYPTSKGFGIYAWTCMSYDAAIAKFKEINTKKLKK